MRKRIDHATFAGLRDVGPASKHVDLDGHELSMLLERIAFAYARTSMRWEP